MSNTANEHKKEIESDERFAFEDNWAQFMIQRKAREKKMNIFCKTCGNILPSFTASKCHECGASNPEFAFTSEDLDTAENALPAYERDFYFEDTSFNAIPQVIISEFNISQPNGIDEIRLLSCMLYLRVITFQACFRFIIINRMKSHPLDALNLVETLARNVLISRGDMLKKNLNSIKELDQQELLDNEKLAIELVLNLPVAIRDAQYLYRVQSDAQHSLHDQMHELLTNRMAHNKAVFEREVRNLESTHQESLTKLNNALNSAIMERQGFFNRSLFCDAIVLKTMATLRQHESAYKIGKYVCLAAGIAIGSTINWWLGLLVAGLGYFLCDGNEKEAHRKMTRIHVKNESVKEQMSRGQNGAAGYSSEYVKEFTQIFDLFGKLFEVARSSEAAALNDFEEKKRQEFDARVDKEESVYQESLQKLLNDNNNSLQRNAEATAARKHQITAYRDGSIKELNAVFETAKDKILNLAAVTVMHHNQQIEYFNPGTTRWSSVTVAKMRSAPMAALRIGQSNFKLKLASNVGVSVPVLEDFFGIANLFVQCTNRKELAEAVTLANNVVARSMLSVPVGKLKLTLIDPVELGRNAGPFTALHKEIYGGMVFTQPEDIEAQLAGLIRSIENIIQRYLQDKHQSFASYNAATSEVQEPYRLLVVYNFPHGFSQSAISKLINIARSGPKAGVQTVLVVDVNAKMPHGVDMAMIESNFKTISIAAKTAEEGDGFCQNELDAAFPYPEMVAHVNTLHQNVDTVKVALSKYIADEREWWTQKSHKEFSVPIGRHATEVQYFKFDNKDDNQALLIGKPGSGKSNLLHTIIINSLWRYSPEELEIYLVDFKGGVEFNVYADRGIPHIRTLAIESEREFGLSVLDGVERVLLDREMKFNAAKVNNIEDYRNSFPGMLMPRILLVIDEFQEFFVEEDTDKSAVDAKFDRIVKKGRAFGINTVLASQTLSGKSILKSTRDLIDIRIALMCGDLDALQILDERNPAARDLTRPGEGIYNSESGKIAGNRRFQAFFSERQQLEALVQRIAEFSKTRPERSDFQRQITFRGSDKAVLTRDDHPISAVQAGLQPKSIKLWMGDPVTIAPEVFATLRRQSGANLLVAGHDEGIGTRVLVSSIASLAAQHLKETAEFYCLNYINPDSEHEGVPLQVFESLECDYRMVGPKHVSEVFGAIEDRLKKRLGGDLSDNKNIFVVCFSAQRGRSLRKESLVLSEDAKKLAFIIKEGPDVGMFTLLQIDTVENFSKVFEERLVREFAHRVASQTNPDNSLKLIGSNKAAKTGANRAFYFDDNENTLMKFKPYELPNFSWLAQLV